MREPPPAITPDVLTTLPAEELSRTVFLRLVELIDYRDRTQPEQYAFVSSLSPGLQMLWGTYLLGNEVFNGGFDQYFYNSSHNWISETTAGLRLLRARPQLSLLDQAVAAVRAVVPAELSFRDPNWRRECVEAGTPDVLDTLARQY